MHLDEVEGLGSFIELEVVLAADQSAEQGTRLIQALMEKLGIGPSDLVGASNVDLLEVSHRRRCAWATTDLSIPYHDQEWGLPVHDDRTLFEFLILEGAQAGLSWETILRKRDRYRVVFEGFDPRAVARFDRRKVARLLADPGIIRNRLKIQAAVANARAFLAVQEKFGSFDAYLWRFVDGLPRRNTRRTLGEIPTRTPESDALSQDLARRGFKFVGSTICYAFMQAVGMVNDHTMDCFRYREVSAR